MQTSQIRIGIVFCTATASLLGLILGSAAIARGESQELEIIPRYVSNRAFRLLFEDPVQLDLGLTAETKAELIKARELLAKKKEESEAVARRSRDRSVAEGKPAGRTLEAIDAESRYEMAVDRIYGSILSKSQLARLNQIEYQRQGLMGFLMDDALPKKLNFSDDQFVQLREIGSMYNHTKTTIESKAARGRAELQRAGGGDPDGSGVEQIRRQRADEYEQLAGDVDGAIRKIMLKSQIRNYEKLLGRPFKFGDIQSMR